MAEQQVDFEADRAAVAWRLAVALGFCAIAVWLIADRAFLSPRITVLDFVETVLALLSLGVFGFFAIALTEDALRRGPVVSVGPRGVFDRRISRDWIGWEWFGDIQPCRWPRGVGLHLYLHPGGDRALPLRRRSRLTSWTNWVVRPGAYWLFTKPLRTDIPTLAATIDRFSGDRLRLVKQWETVSG